MKQSEATLLKMADLIAPRYHYSAFVADAARARSCCRCIDGQSWVDKNLMWNFGPGRLLPSFSLSWDAK